jgi:aminoglycoside phosphotransferase (APT) family kinase protein
MTEARGTSVHELRAAGIGDDQLGPVATFAGTVLDAIWRAPVPDTGGRLRPGWEPFIDLLRRRRAVAPAEHRAAGRLSARLCDRLDAWLPAVDVLVAGAGPAVLLHGDLHGDHLLAERRADGAIAPTAVIDLSDAIAGHPAYDLVALHLDAFGASPLLLRAVLDALPRHARPRPDHALAWSILHEFDPFERWTGDRLAWLGGFDDPHELAHALWAC